MGARSDLNGAYLIGCSILGFAAAIVCDSLALGVGTFAASALIALASGGIRPSPGPRHR